MKHYNNIKKNQINKIKKTSKQMKNTNFKNRS